MSGPPTRRGGATRMSAPPTWRGAEARMSAPPTRLSEPRP
jgi:hypothetical protein